MKTLIAPKDLEEKTYDYTKYLADKYGFDIDDVLVFVTASDDGRSFATHVSWYSSSVDDEPEHAYRVGQALVEAYIGFSYRLTSLVFLRVK